jgi:hypothetical protein
MLIQPHIAPWRGAAGLAQLRLGVQNACALARNFAATGHHVIVLDVLTDETAQLYHQQLADLEHRIVLLLPTLETVLARNQARGQWLTDDEVRLLYAWESALTCYDERIDNSACSADWLAVDLQRRHLAHPIPR